MWQTDRRTDTCAIAKTGHLHSKLCWRLVKIIGNDRQYWSVIAYPLCVFSADFKTPAVLCGCMDTVGLVCCYSSKREAGCCGWPHVQQRDGGQFIESIGWARLTVGPTAVVSWLRAGAGAACKAPYSSWPHTTRLASVRPSSCAMLVHLRPHSTRSTHRRLVVTRRAAAAVLCWAMSRSGAMRNWLKFSFRRRLR